MEEVFFRKQSSIEPTSSNGHVMYQSQDIGLIRVETADFPMKLVTHALIEENKDSITSAAIDDLHHPDYIKFL